MDILVGRDGRTAGPDNRHSRGLDGTIYSGIRTLPIRADAKYVQPAKLADFCQYLSYLAS